MRDLWFVRPLVMKKQAWETFLVTFYPEIFVSMNFVFKESLVFTHYGPLQVLWVCFGGRTRLSVSQA